MTREAVSHHMKREKGKATPPPLPRSSPPPLPHRWKMRRRPLKQRTTQIWVQIIRPRERQIHHRRHGALLGIMYFEVIFTMAIADVEKGRHVTPKKTNVSE